MIHFLNVAQGSLFELETRLIITKKLKFIVINDNTKNQLVEIQKMLWVYIKKLKKKNL